MNAMHATLTICAAALWACAPPPADPVGGPEPAARPEPTLTVDDDRITAAPIPADDPRWAVGAYVEGINDQDWLVATLRVIALRDGVAELRVLAQAPATTLRGVSATLYSLGGPTFAAPILRVRGDRVSIRQDVRLGIGDRGIVLDEAGYPVGGVEVVAIGDVEALGDGAGDPASGLASARLVFGRAHPGDDVRWVLDDPAPLDPGPLRVVVAEEGRVLTDALEARGFEGFAFTSAPDLAPDPDRAAVEAFARRYAADLVVHGRPCATARPASHRPWCRSPGSPPKSSDPAACRPTRSVQR